jgi:hypothetical protein
LLPVDAWRVHARALRQAAGRDEDEGSNAPAQQLRSVPHVLGVRLRLVRRRHARAHRRPPHPLLQRQAAAQRVSA